MKYKAVIFDVDGTLVPSDPNAMPTVAVTQAIQKAHQYAFIAVATGRSRNFALPVMDALDVTNQSVMSGGSMIVDPKTKEIVWEEVLTLEHLEKIAEIYYRLGDNTSRVFFNDAEIGQEINHLDTTKPRHSVSMIEMPEENLTQIANELNQLEGVAAHLMPSWHGDTHNVDITRDNADKEHGVMRLLKMHDLKKEEVIGVGDSSNDFPLFAAVGFRVAMGNATDELKSIADYIAPSIYEDGAAHIIEKFILPKD